MTRAGERAPALRACASAQDTDVAARGARGCPRGRRGAERGASTPIRVRGYGRASPPPTGAYPRVPIDDVYGGTERAEAEPFLGPHGCACPSPTSALLPRFRTPKPALPPPSHLPRPPSRLSCFFPALRPGRVRPLRRSVHPSTPALLAKEHRIPIRFCFVPPPHLHSDDSLLVLTTKMKVFGAHPALAECPSGSNASVGSEAGSDEAFAGLRVWFGLHEVSPTGTPQEP